METRIRKFGARYHLPAKAQSQRERLDRVLREIVNGALELALERAGIGTGEEICVDRLRVPVRLRLGTTDAALIAAWSVALAEAIRRAAAGATLPGVIRYTSRVQALVDMVSAVVVGNFDRTWAWRELGIWCAVDTPDPAAATDQVVGALTAEPEFIVPVLHSLAGSRVVPATLERLASTLQPQHWTRLARAALEVLQLNGDLIAQAEPGIAESSRPVRRMLETSAIARALLAHPRREWQASVTSEATVRRAAAILIVLEADAGILRGGSTRARAAVGAVADALYPVELRLTRPTLLPPDRRESPAAPRTESTPTPATPPRNRQTPTAPPQHTDPPEIPNDQPPIPDLRRRAFTRFAGVLFLLHIVADLELPSALATLPLFAARSFPWIMQQLALALVPTSDADDPAVLVFAGLMPDSVPPSRGEPAPSDAEREALDALAARITAELEQRLPHEEKPLDSLCSRQAEILADPGWIEVHLSLTTVSTAIRRAGLDLDLGFLPWLGVVLRFVYE